MLRFGLIEWIFTKKYLTKKASRWAELIPDPVAVTLCLNLLIAEKSHDRIRTGL
jgi:hypothetical protein